MKKRTILFVVILLVTFMVTYGEYKYMASQVAETPLTMVCFVTKSLEAGQVISEDDLVYKAVSTADLESEYITSKSDLVGSYTTTAVAKGATCIRNQFSEAKNLSMVSRPDHILVTFEFNHETANGWNIRKGQSVQLLLCEEEASTTLYNNVIVFNIYNKNGNIKGEEEGVPLQYVTFEMPKDVGHDLVENRHKGRLEIIVL